MRHFYFRLVVSFIWIAAGIVNAVMLDLPFAVLSIAMGILFGRSAASIWKEEHKEDEK